MFARYFIELPIEPPSVERALTDAPANWLRGLASEANHRGDTLLADVGFGGRVRVAREVAVELGAPVHTAGKTVLPIRWTPTGASGLFPALEADLEVAPLASNLTQLAMSARYVPPLGPIGHAIDRAVLYRIAEATLKDFLDRVGDALIMAADADIGERRDVPAVTDEHAGHEGDRRGALVAAKAQRGQSPVRSRSNRSNRSSSPVSLTVVGRSLLTTCDPAGPPIE